MKDDRQDIPLEFQDLFDAAANDELAEEQFAAIERLLLDDDEARATYFQYFQLDTDLDLLFQGDRANDRTLAHIESLKNDSQSLEVVGSTSDAAPSILTAHSSRRRRRLSMASRHLAVGVTIAVAFVATSLSLMHQIILPERVASKDENTEKPAKDPGPIESIARLVSDVEAQWEGHVENPVFDRKQRIKTGMKLYPGQKLTLTSGLAEFKFFNGAEVVLEGPAVFEVQGKKQCALTLGRLVAKANEERSKGFIVETPTGRVEDLGTEFAVAVDETGNNQVVVFSGEVDVQTDLASGEMRHTRLVEKQSAVIVLAGGDARITVSKSEPGHPLAKLHRQTHVAPIGGVTIHEVSSELAGGGTNFGRAAIHTVDRSGLVGRGHVDVPPDGTMWLSRGEFAQPHSKLPEHIVFDLGAHYDLSAIRVWNYNESTNNLTSRGAKEVEISVAGPDEPTAFTKLENSEDEHTFEFPRANGRRDYRGFHLDLRNVNNSSELENVRYIRFDIKSSHGNNPKERGEVVGLSEVMFFGAAVDADANEVAAVFNAETNETNTTPAKDAALEE